MMDTVAPRADSSAPVPLLDLRAQYQPLKAEILRVIEEVCDSQSFILGAYVKRLEADVAAYSATKHGIGMSSGTDALLAALMALDVGPGDEVITSPYSFFATGGVVSRLRARPVFCDVDRATYNLSAAAVERFIAEQCDAQGGTLRNRRTGNRVRVLMPVHLYGQCADMDALLALAQRHGLAVVEDAAQAIGAEATGGRRAGSMGDIGCFSFFPSKNLGAFGDAGMCTARDDALAEKLRVLRVHGGKPKYYHSMIGGNFRLDELQAAVLTVKLAHLEAWTLGRQRNADLYDRLFRAAGLDATVGLPHRVPGHRHIFNQYVIRVPKRDALREHLAAAHIGTEIYYPVPLHLQQCFADLGGRPGDCPESEQAARETLALPIYPELTEAQLNRVVNTIRAFYA
jgi:dTDP-4-amino-4,6-dideoxygalactose transaminase